MQLKYIIFILFIFITKLVVSQNNSVMPLDTIVLIDGFGTINKMYVERSKLKQIDSLYLNKSELIIESFIISAATRYSDYECINIGNKFGPRVKEILLNNNVTHFYMTDFKVKIKNSENIILLKRIGFRINLID